MESKSCRHDKKNIVLYYYGELDELASADVEVRLEVCAACKDYYSGLVAMESVLPRLPSVEPSDTVMEAIRAVTTRRIRDKVRRRVRPSEPRHFGLFIPGWARMSALVSAIVLVFLGGRWSTELKQESFAGLGPETIMDVSEIAYDSTTGNVSVQYRTSDASAVQGTFRDEKVLSLVTYALTNTDSPSTQFRAVKMLAEITGDRLEPDPELVAALASILRDDTNQGMQLQAITALRRITGGTTLDSEMTELLMGLLEFSSNSALRIHALEMLTESELTRLDLNRVLARAARDENSFIRFKARSALDDLEGSIPLDQIN